MVERWIINSLQVVGLMMIITLPAQALTVTATVDRQQIHIDETLKLRLRVDETATFEKPDFSQLRQQFDILRNQPTNRHSMTNGKIESWTDWHLVLSPKAPGNLLIPAINYNGEHSEPITIEVTSSPTSAIASNATVVLEASVDIDSAYVGQQIIYTLTMFHRVNLSGLDDPTPQIPDAVVFELDASQYEITRGGVRYGAYEKRFAVFPQASGTLSLPSVRYTATTSNRRSLLSSRGQTVRPSSEALALEIKASPSQFPGSHWLPAKQLQLTEHWSSDQQTIEVGESITRSVQMQAVGLDAGQLSPVPWPTLGSTKVYPEQAQTDNAIQKNGVIGNRVEAIAMVATEPGLLTIPAIKIPWWNTQTQQVEMAILPERQLTVVAPAHQPQALPVPQLPDTTAQTPPKVVTETVYVSPWPWMLATAVCGLGWLITALLWWHKRQSVATPSTATPAQYDEQTWKALSQACQSSNLSVQRQALWQWMLSHWQPRENTIAGLQQVDAPDDLIETLRSLDQALYSADKSQVLDSKQLLNIAKQAKKTDRIATQAKSDLAELYPS